MIECATVDYWCRLGPRFCPVPAFYNSSLRGHLADLNAVTLWIYLDVNNFSGYAWASVNGPARLSTSYWLQCTAHHCHGFIFSDIIAAPANCPAYWNFALSSVPLHRFQRWETENSPVLRIHCSKDYSLTK